MAPIFHESVEHIPHFNLTKSLYNTITGTQTNLTSKIPPIGQELTSHVNTDTVDTNTHNTTLALILTFVIIIGISFWKWFCVRNDRIYKLPTNKNSKEDAGKPEESEKTDSVVVKETQERKDSLDIMDVGSEDVQIQIQTQNSPQPQSLSQQECTGGVDEADITARK